MFVLDMAALSGRRRRFRPLLTHQVDPSCCANTSCAMADIDGGEMDALWPLARMQPDARSHPPVGESTPPQPDDTSASGPRLIIAEEAARLLGVPKTWVLAEARADRIPHVRLGRYVRFEPGELETWWHARRRGPRLRPGQVAY